MKYIIELEDEPMIANSFHQEADELWKAKGFNSLVFDKCGLDKLTPYIESDRKAIENEVWEFAQKFTHEPKAELNAHERVEIWGTASCDKIINDFTYSEAKAKYEAWKNQKEDEATMKEVTALAEKIGIHKLYSMVKEIRGE